jgi:hypothetical protein
MKKTLVALAVLAASGASFAQASISGSYGFGYTNQLNGIKGFNTTAGGLTIKNTEDMGGGNSLTATLNMDLRGRGNSFQATDANLVYAGAWGNIVAGSVEAGNAISNKAGAPISLANDVQDGVILDAAGNVDIVGATFALGSGLSLGVTYTDGGTAYAAVAYTGNATSAATGAGSGAAQSMGAKLSYAAGPLAASLGYTSYISNEDTLNTTTAAFAALSGKRVSDGASRIQITATYDLGVAKLGFGYQTRSQTASVNDLVGSAGAQSDFSIAAPMGAFTVGATYSNRAANGTTLAGAASALTGGTAYTMGATYALSKQTSANVSYGQQSRPNVAVVSESRVSVTKSF